MVEFKRICGIVMLAMALMFGLRIPSHLRSTDPHQQSLVHVDYVLIFILGGSGLVLLLSRGRSSDGAKLKKPVSSRSIALQGVALILFLSILSFRNIVLSTGKVVVGGQVVAVNHPATRSSGTTSYHLTYQCTDFSGTVRTADDIVQSINPILVGNSIDVAYSQYHPEISRAASKYSRWSFLGIGLGVLYEFFALILYFGRKSQKQTAFQEQS